MGSIEYRDFLPEAVQRGGLFGGVDFASFDNCVDALNEWLRENPVNVIRIETVTLPNIHSVAEQGSHDSELHTSSHAVWYQFVRLWYSGSVAKKNS
jgi:hypothetical protein